MENVEVFIDQIIEEKGYSDLDPEVMAQLKADLTDRLVDILDHRLISALSDEKAQELSEKLDDPNFSEEDMYAFITGEGGVDVQQVMIDTMIQFKLFYVNGDEVLGNDSSNEPRMDFLNATPENANAVANA